MNAGTSSQLRQVSSLSHKLHIKLEHCESEKLLSVEHELNVERLRLRDLLAGVDGDGFHTLGVE